MSTLLVSFAPTFQKNLLLVVQDTVLMSVTDFKCVMCKEVLPFVLKARWLEMLFTSYLCLQNLDRFSKNSTSEAFLSKSIKHFSRRSVYGY